MSATKSFSFKRATAQARLVVVGTPGTIISVLTGLVAEVAGTPVTLSTNGGSGSGVVTYAATYAASTPPCRITAGVLTGMAGNICTVTATKAGGQSGSIVYSSQTGMTTFTFSAPVSHSRS